MIEAFLRPFLGGVFLERELETPVRQLAFVWSQFASPMWISARPPGASTRQTSSRNSALRSMCRTVTTE